MANQNKEVPNSAKAGVVTFAAGIATLIASGARMKVDFPGVDTIPSPIFHNLDTVTAKLANSGMILIIAGSALLIAGLIYAGYKQNSSASESIKKEEKPIESGPLSINTSPSTSSQ